MEDLKNEYQKLAAQHECAQRIVLASIQNLRKEMEISGDRIPISSVSSRIKTFESAIEKCGRKLDSEPTIETLRTMHDIAGVRIVTYFEDDVYAVRDSLYHKPEFSVIEERDYIANSKPNGYRSLHLIVSVNVYFLGISKAVPVEIQIRDKAMDLWASIEHNISYKSDDSSPEAEKSFKHIADVLAKFDQEAMRLRDKMPSKSEASDDGSGSSSSSEKRKISKPKPAVKAGGSPKVKKGARLNVNADAIPRVKSDDQKNGETSDNAKK